MVLDLKILMYRNTDEIEKLKKFKADSDREMEGALKQLKTLSESRDSMQRELVELEFCHHHHPPVCGSRAGVGEVLLV